VAQKEFPKTVCEARAWIDYDHVGLTPIDCERSLID
jgi:hypothetical protein